MQKSMQLRRGFTLIELLVVIAIIGILASVVLVNLNTARLRARDAERISTVDQVKLALQLFFDDNDKYPDDGEIWNPSTNPIATRGLVGAYMPITPTAPAGGGVGYSYDQGATVTVYCFGVDLESDTAAPGNDTNCDADGAGGFDWAAATNPSAYSVSP